VADVEVRIPGSQSFNRAQLIALGELHADLEAGGFESELPFETRGHIPAPDAVLDAVGLYILARGGKRLIDTVTDDVVDGLYSIAKSWAKRQLVRFQRERPDGLPPATIKVTIYGPDGLPLRTIEVPDENDGV
jgi:hypothetical protein